MIEIPVKLQCACGCKVDFVVYEYDTAKAWMKEFWDMHQVCKGQPEPEVDEDQK